MTNRIKSTALILSGVVIGCGAAATVGASWAGPTPGQWTCYKGNAFPEVQEWTNGTQAMNQIARSAPTGTVVSMIWGQHPLVCVRD